MNFSVLMSIYAKTRASDLTRCLDSLSQQTLPAAEIILIKDGPISSDVERCIRSYESEFLFKQLAFPDNRGLGPALRDGLNACSYELIARVDSDDWSVPDRFHKQTQFLHSESSISVVGGELKENYGVRGKSISVIRRNSNGSCFYSACSEATQSNQPSHCNVSEEGCFGLPQL